jgi:hypothetical protein
VVIQRLGGFSKEHRAISRRGFIQQRLDPLHAACADVGLDLAVASGQSGPHAGTWSGGHELHTLVEAVQVRGAENEQVCITFSPRFEHIWLECKKSLLDSLAQKPVAIGLRSKYAIRLYYLGEKPRLNGKKARHIGRTAQYSDWIQ